jgi:hypothetical protein
MAAKAPLVMVTNTTAEGGHQQQRETLTSSFMDLSPLEPPPLEKVKIRGWVVAMAPDASSSCLRGRAAATGNQAWFSTAPVQAVVASAACRSC